jgi:hypothetical protein
VGVWVPMTRADGQPFMQWRRSTRTEPLPDERNCACLCCGNQPGFFNKVTGVWSGERIHDLYMHNNWRTDLPDAGGSRDSVITPRPRTRLFGDDS